jgi:hypothetical protein
VPFAENRDLTEREKQLSSDDLAELEALRKAEAVREHRERVTQAFQQAVDTTPRPETRAAFGEFVEALTRGIPHRVRIETRSVTTAVAGARGARWQSRRSVGRNGCGRPPEFRFSPRGLAHRQRAEVRRFGGAERDR